MALYNAFSYAFCGMDNDLQVLAAMFTYVYTLNHGTLDSLTDLIQTAAKNHWTVLVGTFTYTVY